jgi:DNA ligase IV
MFFTKVDEQDEIAGNVDQYSDSYARDVTVAELKEVPFASRCILLKSTRIAF